MAKEFLKLLFRLKLNFCAYDYLSASTNPYFYKFILPIYIPISPGQSQEQLSILFLIEPFLDSFSFVLVCFKTANSK